MDKCSLHRDLARLPDEVLLNIIFMARADDHCDVTNKDLLQLAAVSRRFRDITFSYAPLWTKLDNELNHNSLEVALVRSKQAPLSVHVFTTEDTKNASSTLFLNKILPHFHRVSSLTLTLAGTNNDRYGPWYAIAKVLTTLAQCDLPRLERFELRAPPRDEEDFEDEPYYPPLERDDDLYHVYTKWNAPNLRHIHLEELMPRIHTGLTLTSVNLLFDEDWHSVDYPLTRLLRFLESQPSLENISIGIDQLHEKEFHWKETIHFPVLHTFDFMVSMTFDEADCASFVPTIMRCFSMPFVESMLILFSTNDKNFTMESLFPHYRDYPRMKRFSFQMYQDGNFSLDVAPFATIFAKFPDLRYLQVSIVNSSVVGDVPSPLMHPPPPLEELILEKCSTLGAYALEQVLEYISQGRHLDKLKRVFVDKCPWITGAHVDVLAGIVPRNKLHVVPVSRTETAVPGAVVWA